MPDPAPFLAAIASNPDDDLPRLVYADWLDENGDPARAEFIRLQCHTARVGPLDPSWAPAELREYDLFKANETKWRPGQRDDISHMLMARWRRGFPACIDLGDVAIRRLTDGEWCNGAFHWAAAAGGQFDPWPPVGPVREVQFSGWRPGCGEILRTEQLRTVRALSLMEWYAGVNPGSIENFAVELARFPQGHFPELISLDLDQGELNLPALEALSIAPALRTLTHLSLQFPDSVRPFETPYWYEATRGLFSRICPQVERLELHGLPPELANAFNGITWAELRSLSILHRYADGLSTYDFSQTPSLNALSIYKQPRLGQPDPNSLEAFDDGWPEASLRVLALGSVPVEELRPWLAYPERFSLDFLSADVKGGRLRMDELNSYPLTRGLKGLAGSFTNADLAPLADPTVLPELHTIWSGDTKPLPKLWWRGGTRTVIPKDGKDAWRERPSRASWCHWHDELFG